MGTKAQDEGRRRSGGLKQVGAEVWLVDLDLPRQPGERRRRVSRTVHGTEADAEAVLVELRRAVAEGSTNGRPTSKPTAAKRTKRTGGVGGITQRGPDRWLIGVEGAPDPITAERRRHTRMIRGSRDDAEVALARLRVDHAAAEFRTATSARDVRAACDLYLSEVRTEKSTVRTDRSACHRICETQIFGGSLGDVALDKLDWKLLEYVYAVWGRTLTPKTVVRYGSTLSKVLEHAKRSGWISTNPGREAKLPRVPSHRPDVPQRERVQAALRSAEESDPMMHAYVLGLAAIGCRRGELLALRPVDVDFDVPMVTIRGAIGDGGPGVGTYYKNTKRSDWRDVPITDQVASALRELLVARQELLGEELDPGSYVFSDAADGSTCMRPDTMTHRWLAVRGPHNVTFAMLRRFVATELLDSTDGDYRTVASITGNSEETLRRWYDAEPNFAKKKAVLGRARL